MTDEFQGLSVHTSHHVEPALAPNPLLLLVTLAVDAVQVGHSQVAVDVLAVQSLLELGLYKFQRA